MLIPCPWCGPRAQVEFTYGGDATVRRPAPDAPIAAWVEFVYLRDNPAGLATSLAPALDPMARRIRQQQESPRGRLVKDLLYAALVMAALPFTIIEAACRAGSTIMIEARKKT